MIRLVAINRYGMNFVRHEFSIPLIRRDYYCFNGEAKMHMYDGTLKNAEDVRIGDVLRAGSGGPTTVKRVKETTINNVHRHPIFMNDGRTVTSDGCVHRYVV